ncbi:hypothetical protein PRUPE_5G093100 [Prunus persica]|uniref:C2 domain-containing protein n=1 Tax=Prunus persica TaxID=3760 RepID=A0A251P7F4_PRUPE|nr:hypothetical protein PRUPE_5G093100 [Prunus persica]
MKMEITVISAQGLKTTSPTTFSNKIRTFITLTTTNGDHKCHVYSTGVDDEGGINPTWGDKFHVPVDTSFFTNRYSCIYLQLYSKRLIMGRTQLGWCQISAQDIGFPPAGSARYLSYRLRARDGSRTNGIVNLSVKLENLGPVSGHGQTNSVNAPAFGMCGTGTVIGTPVTALLPPLGECSVNCEGQLDHVGFGCKEAHRWATCDSEGHPSRN